MRTFKQLTHKDRDRMEALLDTGVIQAEVSRILKVDRSTISREVAKRKKKNGHYEADVATHKAQVLRSNSKYQGMKIEKYPELKKHIIAQLKERRSPDEIAGRMKREKIVPRIGTSAIYKWIYSSFGSAYTKYLCTKRMRKRKQKRKAARSLIPNLTSIHKRPLQGWHGEGDTFVSPRKIAAKDAVAVTIHVKTKYLTATKIPDHKPASMAAAMQKATNGVLFDTLTFDRGIENRYHEQFGVDAFFCDPHSPWQKPRVENVIGLIRRWSIPKKSDLSLVSEEYLEHEINFLNKKYRKVLQYESAEEAARRCGILKTTN
jgi:IS30 family transposase